VKILIAHNRYCSPGGEDEVFLQESELLRRAGHEVLEYTAHNSEILEAGILNKAKMAGRTFWATSSVAQLRSVLRREKPDLAHFHNTFPLISPAAYYACQQEGVPVVQSVHNARMVCPAANFYRAGHVCEDCLGRVVPWPGILHGCYRNSRLQTAVVAGMLAGHRILGTWRDRVDVYVAFTEFYRRKLVQAGLPSEKIFVKPHFLPADPGIKQKIGEYVLFVGRLAPEKGVRTLLEAFALLQKEIPLHIVGDGPLRTEMETQKDRCGLSRLFLHGRLPREQTLEFMRGARFLIFPSECPETFGLAMIEAFACGVPVIASRLAPMTEIVADGKTGFHFTTGDANDLAAKVDWALTHASEMETMGRAARAEYLAKYTAERNYQLLMEMYRRAQNAPAWKAA
jgi:glycosyltransferase involved in cell wall biosynthesis